MSLVKQKITPFFPDTNQVSVKNPATVGKYIIKPGDGRHSLLTAASLRQFLKPNTTINERRPDP